MVAIEFLGTDTLFLFMPVFGQVTDIWQVQYILGFWQPCLRTYLCQWIVDWQLLSTYMQLSGMLRVASFLLDYLIGTCSNMTCSLVVLMRHHCSEMFSCSMDASFSLKLIQGLRGFLVFNSPHSFN